MLVVAALAEHEHVGIAYDLPLAPQVVLETGVLDGADVIGGDVEERGDVEMEIVDAVDFVCL